MNAGGASHTNCRLPDLDLTTNRGGDIRSQIMMRCTPITIERVTSNRARRRLAMTVEDQFILILNMDHLVMLPAGV